MTNSSGDTARALAKRREVTDLVRRSLDDLGIDVDSTEVATSLVNELVSLTPPTSSAPYVEMIVMKRDWTRGAESTKPGNLVVNFRRLIVGASGGVLAAVGVAGAPWLAPFAFIVLVDSLWAGASIKVSERHAALLWTMWEHRRGGNRVAKDQVHHLINQELAKHDRPPISQGELDSALDDLVEFRCIETAASDPEAWWLREWVKVTYR
jgi:hypothetical protein